MSANMPICGLYAVTDAALMPVQSFLAQAEAALRGGAQLLQYRDKSAETDKRRTQAQALQALCRDYVVPLIINDDVQLARQVQAAGVHLGREDGLLSEARAYLGASAIIGISCYNELLCAQQAQAQGADYVAFGSFYPSPTKPLAARATPELLRQARQVMNLPIVAIGGIQVDHALALVRAGADCLAVISGLFGQTDIAAAARRYQAVFDA